MIFYQKNQQLRTVDLFILIILVGVVSSVLGAVLAETFQDNRPQRAEAMAEHWASHIRSQQAHASSTTSSRSPASLDTAPVFYEEGDIGRDPWGHPFHYLLKADSAPNHWRVFVWSDGADGKSETNAHDISANALAPAHASGDDILYAEDFASE